MLSARPLVSPMKRGTFGLKVDEDMLTCNVCMQSSTRYADVSCRGSATKFSSAASDYKAVCRRGSSG